MRRPSSSFGRRVVSRYTAPCLSAAVGGRLVDVHVDPPGGAHALRVAVSVLADNGEAWLEGIRVVLHPEVAVRFELADRVRRQADLDLEDPRLIALPRHHVDPLLCASYRVELHAG